LVLEGGDCVVANGVKDEFLPRLFDAQVIPVTLLLDFVLPHKLFACGCRVAGIEGICRVRSSVGGYRVGPGGVANDKSVLAFGDCTCQVARLLSLSVVMGLFNGEDSAELVLGFVNSLQGDQAIEACQFVPKVDEHDICFVQC
jgi:hypothetical protein